MVAAGIVNLTGEKTNTENNRKLKASKNNDQSVSAFGVIQPLWALILFLSDMLHLKQLNHGQLKMALGHYWKCQ